MVSLGGWAEGSAKFSKMTSNPRLRTDFVRNTLVFLRENGFDGIDLAWQYPGLREGSSPYDKENYVTFIQV
jgi:GH18 family chitinase